MATRTQPLTKTFNGTANSLEVVVDQSFRPTFEAFARNQYRKLVGTLSLYCGDPETASEIAHEALVRTMEKWDRVQNHDSPSAWLFRVAFNLTNSRFRRRKAERKAVERLQADQSTTSHSNHVADRTTLRAALLELPPYQRQVIVLRYYLDLNVDETARYLDKTTSSVKSATHRALKRLRNTLGEQSVTEAIK